MSEEFSGGGDEGKFGGFTEGAEVTVKEAKRVGRRPQEAEGSEVKRTADLGSAAFDEATAGF